MFKRKAKHLGKNKARVIKLPRAAIKEIVWETLIEIGCDRLDIDPKADDISFRMTLNDDMSELVFYAYDYPDGEQPDCESFDRYIDENVGVTTQSVYTLGKGKCYQTIDISDSEK